MNINNPLNNFLKHQVDVSKCIALDFLRVAELLALRSVCHDHKKFIDCTDIWEEIAKIIGVPATKKDEIRLFEVIKTVYQSYFRIHNIKYCVYEEKENGLETPAFNLNFYNTQKEKKLLEVIRNVGLEKICDFISSIHERQIQTFQIEMNNNPNVIGDTIASKCFSIGLMKLTLLKNISISPPPSFYNHQNNHSLLSYGMISNEIGNFTQLQSLHLNFQPISFFPAGIKNLKNLKEIIVTNCYFTNIDFIVHLPSIEKASFSGNKLKNIPDLSGLINLTRLDLSNNKIKEISASFNKILSVSALNLDDNKLNRKIDLYNLSDLKKLTTLSLRHNGIEKLKNLKILINLTQLNIQNNQIKSSKDLLELTKLLTLVCDYQVTQGNSREKLFIGDLPIVDNYSYVKFNKNIDYLLEDRLSSIICNNKRVAKSVESTFRNDLSSGLKSAINNNENAFEFFNNKLFEIESYNKKISDNQELKKQEAIAKRQETIRRKMEEMTPEEIEWKKQQTLAKRQETLKRKKAEKMNNGEDDLITLKRKRNQQIKTNNNNEYNVNALQQVNSILAIAQHNIVAVQNNMLPNNVQFINQNINQIPFNNYHYHNNFANQQVDAMQFQNNYNINNNQNNDMELIQNNVVNQAASQQQQFNNNNSFNNHLLYNNNNQNFQSQNHYTDIDPPLNHEFDQFLQEFDQFLQEKEGKKEVEGKQSISLKVPSVSLKTIRIQKQVESIEVEETEKTKKKPSTPLRTPRFSTIQVESIETEESEENGDMDQ